MSKGGKSIAFKPAAAVVKPPPAADAWVADRGGQETAPREGGTVTTLKPAEPAPEPKEKMVRFTIDVPEGLHRRVKMQCAARGQKMADMLREVLEREFPAS